MLALQQISNFGTSTPAIARTTIQGDKILNFFNCSEEQKNNAIIVLWNLQRHLLKCHEICIPIESEILAGRANIESKSLKSPGSNYINLPSVLDLESKTEAFIGSAKLAIIETGNLIKPFYANYFEGEKDFQGHNFHKLIEWSSKKFGIEDRFTLMLQAAEPNVKKIVDMRNAVEHPKQNKRLITKNFELIENTNSAFISEPKWGLSNEQMTALLPDLHNIIEGILTLGEAVIIELFHKFKADFPGLFIDEIPVEKRNPECPCRISVTCTFQ
ncbi:conserved hypothetical protein [Candidatus Nitrotoga sp. HW29]|uniref:hypothetical protein n=1 Tax=Candidatus Nitrotoga sp. HW29 TaxID=2886963 RepID=UPI001EF1D68A|nr:hypothetical protein [Candidatus Nitrotoga sp. HW29]CAH1904211.1 conserved hypothetical protein [Candidatus Nitrotoga sp. HW29]